MTSLIFENFYFDYYSYRFGLGIELGLGLGLMLGLRVSFLGYIIKYLRTPSRRQDFPIFLFLHS